MPEAWSADAAVTTFEYTHSGIRKLERASIRAFLESRGADLTGRVLDLGCGKQPYRGLVEACGGLYVPYDRAEFPANVSGADVGDVPVGSFDAVLCTQVIQYAIDPAAFLHEILLMLDDRDGALVMTYPTCWDWIEPDDLWRFTPAGMANLLTEAGFRVMHSEERAAVELGGFRFPLGYGVVARPA